MSHWDEDDNVEPFSAKPHSHPASPTEEEELRQLREALRHEEEPLDSPDDPNDDGLEDTLEVPWSEKLEN